MQMSLIAIAIPRREPWERAEIFDRSIRTFRATIGPSGGKKGYQGITGVVETFVTLTFNSKQYTKLHDSQGKRQQA